MKRIASITALIGLALTTSAALAQYQPHRDINYNNHPHLAQAQSLVDQAFRATQAARQANQNDLGGHAARAQQLLDEASRELKEAAETANARGR